jgi:hypothetical protein
VRVNRRGVEVEAEDVLRCDRTTSGRAARTAAKRSIHLDSAEGNLSVWVGREPVSSCDHVNDPPRPFSSSVM